MQDATTGVKRSRTRDRVSMHIKLLAADDAQRTSFTTKDRRVITPRPGIAQTLCSVVNFPEKFSVTTSQQV